MSLPNDARTAIYLKLKYKAWDVRNRERSYKTCFGYKERWRGLISEMRTLHNHGWGVGIESCNIALRRYGGAGKGFYAEQVLLFMKEKDITPNSTSWLYLLNAYSRQMKKKEAGKVVAIWNHLKTDPATLTQDVYHSLVRALCLVKKQKTAYRIICLLQRDSKFVGHDRLRFYTPLISSLFKKWKVVVWLCRKVWNEPGRQSDFFLHQAVLKAASWHGKYEVSKVLFLTANNILLISAHHKENSSKLYGYLLRAATRAGAVDEAVKVWNAIPKHIVTDFCLAQYLNLCTVAQGMVEVKPLYWFDKLVEEGRCGRSIHVWGALFEHLAATKNTKELADRYKSYNALVGKPWHGGVVLQRILKLVNKTGQ
eukprot:TRINITY_DN1651_c0_g1_i1.p1 TRINITY_DN1651_c0_g1~~TRINITY_DN1651_c0_g1_i1.p1  ORF type:complete len:368 (+),score=67.29 TRINITY_DN1651_c0_g1_i1:524-1627(+)